MTPDAERQTLDGGKSKINMSTPTGGHVTEPLMKICTLIGDAQAVRP